MGGTTAKASVIRDGQPSITTEFHVGGKGSFGGRRAGTGVPIKTPAIDLAEVGAGGGSIAWVDEGGALRVGPQSAGSAARPGLLRAGRRRTDRHRCQPRPGLPGPRHVRGEHDEPVDANLPRRPSTTGSPARSA